MIVNPKCGKISLLSAQKWLFLSQKCTFGISAPSTFKTVWLRNSVLHAHTHCK